MLILDGLPGRMEEARGARSQVVEEGMAALLRVGSLRLVWSLLRYVRHAQWRDGILDRGVAQGSRASQGGWTFAEDGLAPAQPVPLDNLILRRRLKVFSAVVEVAPGFISFHLAAWGGDTTNDSSSGANGVGLGLKFRLFLRGDLAHLVEISLEDSGIGDVLGGFGQLQQDDTSADLQKA